MGSAFDDIPSFGHVVEHLDGVAVYPCLPVKRPFHRCLLGNFTVRNCRENLGNSCDKVLPLGLIDMGLPKPAEAQTLTTPFDQPSRPAPVLCGHFRFGNTQLVTNCNRLKWIPRFVNWPCFRGCFQIGNNRVVPRSSFELAAGPLLLPHLVAGAAMPSGYLINRDASRYSLASARAVRVPRRW